MIESVLKLQLEGPVNRCPSFCCVSAGIAAGGPLTSHLRGLLNCEIVNFIEFAPPRDLWPVTRPPDPDL